MRWINRVGSALVTVLVIAGPPVMLALWLRARRWRLPTSNELHAWIDQPPGRGTIAAMIGCVAVTGWLLLVYALVRRARYTVAGMMARWRRVPLPTPAQMTAGSMAGMAVLALPATVVQQPNGTTPASSPADVVPSHPQTPTAQIGVELPGGGWVPYRTALAVTILGTAIWLHRRQHYQPRPPGPGQHHDDTDLTPLPATAEAIIAATGELAPAHSAPDRTLLPDLPDGLVILQGPGAASAARGLLVTTLLNTALTAGPRTTVTARPSDLQLLLAGSTADALPKEIRLDETAVSNALRRCGVDHAASQRPTLVLSAENPAETPGSAGQTVVVVDDGLQRGRRWFVAVDGGISGTDVGTAQRLCLLGPQPATDLLLLAGHHTSITAAAPADPADAGTQRSLPGQLQLLGDCLLRLRGQPVTIRRSAGLQVLAYLAVHPDGATTTELIRALWPGLDPNTITKRLHTTLTDLRQQLQPYDVIVRQDERYRLNPDTVDTDLHHLRETLVAATTAVTDQQRQNAGQALLQTYGGELAAGFTWPWLHRPREAVRRDVIDAYLHLAATAGPAQAVDLVHAAMTADPYNKAAHAQAQRILAAAGQPGALGALPHRLS